MPRFEITNYMAGGIPLERIKAELRKAGGTRVSARHAFGWANQPHVATFAATDDKAARQVCDLAGLELHKAELSTVSNPLIPYAYQES